MKKKNPIAKDLRTSKYKKRIVKHGGTQKYFGTRNNIEKSIIFKKE